MITPFELALGFVILMFGMSQILDSSINSSKMPKYKKKFIEAAASFEKAGTLELIHRTQSTINSFFLTLYGRNHISIRCIKYSIVSSLFFTSFISLLFPSTSIKIFDMDLLNAIILIVFNLLVDYLSLSETRYVLSRDITKITDALWYAFFDFLLTAFIFVSAYISTQMFFSQLIDPYVQGFSDRMDFVFEDGKFIIYLILFPSTFFTSIVFYIFLTSSFLIRIFNKPAIKAIAIIGSSDNPFKVITSILGLVTALLAWWGTSSSS